MKSEKGNHESRSERKTFASLSQCILAAAIRGAEQVTHESAQGETEKRERKAEGGDKEGRRISLFNRSQANALIPPNKNAILRSLAAYNVHSMIIMARRAGDDARSQHKM